MRPIHLARLDRTQPVLVLTRELIRSRLTNVTVAPITTQVRGIASEIPVGAANGLDKDCVVNCDEVQTIRTEQLGRQLGFLLDEQEVDLSAAIRLAFDLDQQHPGRVRRGGAGSAPPLRTLAG